MTAIKNHRAGFTLFEVMAALFMMSILLSSVMLLQQQSFSSIITSSKKLMLSLVAHRVLYQRIIEQTIAPQKKKATSSKVNGQVTSTSTEKQLSSSSALKEFKQIRQFTSAATTQEGRQPYTFNLITYRYKPKAKKQ